MRDFIIFPLVVVIVCYIVPSTAYVIESRDGNRLADSGDLGQLLQDRNLSSEDTVAVERSVRPLRRRIHKRYVLNNYKWKQLNLTWSFRDPHLMFKGKKKEFRIVKSVIASALDKWSAASGRRLVFQDIQTTAPHLTRDPRIRGDLDVLFARYDHGDKEPFDGRGGIVAHSGYPMEGIVHFDGSEFWSINGRKRGGIDLRFVSLHEIGHALGLRHSADAKAIMHPYYRNNTTGDFNLSDDDIAGIRALYGSQ